MQQIIEDLDLPDLADFDFAPGPLQIQQSRIDDITLQEENFDTRSLREQSLMVDELGECESNFDEELEIARRNFELQQSTSGEWRRCRVCRPHAVARRRSRIGATIRLVPRRQRVNGADAA